MGLEKNIKKEFNWKSFVASITLVGVVGVAAILDHYFEDKSEYFNLNEAEKVIEFYNDEGKRQKLPFEIRRRKKDNLPEIIIIYPTEK